MSIGNFYTSSYYSRRSQIFEVVWFVFILSLSVFFVLAIFKFSLSLSIIAWMLYGIALVVILFRPRYGLYIVLFFSLVGDANLIPWYPFLKNFSSRESIFFLSDSLIISPLESILIITLFSWLIRIVTTRQYSIKLGELFLPVSIFTSFILFGLVYGLARGGDVTIALWEARPIFCLMLILVLVTNLIERRTHINILMWCAMSALIVEGVIGTYVSIFVLHNDLTNINSLTEHSASVHMNTLFVLAMAVWLYRGSTIKRFLIPFLSPFVMYTYLMSQRRAAFVALGLTIALVLITLFFENRKLFWKISIPLTVFILVYFAVFWHSTSIFALPVEAVKSVIAPDQASLEDQLSNIYRVLENLNTSFTIHTVPLTGVGFGKPFYIIVSMPDISNFIWWQYITHNSILWIWMQTGVFGFIALLYLIGCSIMMGIRNFLSMSDGDMRAVAFVAVTYICMHFLYAYVDMSWDTQSMLYIGVMLGLINSMKRIVRHPSIYHQPSAGLGK